MTSSDRNEGGTGIRVGPGMVQLCKIVRNLIYVGDFPGDSVVRNQPANAGGSRLDPLGQGSPGGGNSNPLQESLANYSPRGGKDSDTVEPPSTHAHTACAQTSTCLPASATKPLMRKGREERIFGGKF